MSGIPPSGSTGPAGGLHCGPRPCSPFSPHLCCFDLTEAGLKGLGEKPAGMFAAGGGAPAWQMWFLGSFWRDPQLALPPPISGCPGTSPLLALTLHSLQSSSIQSLSRVQLSATPWTAAGQASLSIANSRSLLRLMPIESVMPLPWPPLFDVPPLCWVSPPLCAELSAKLSCKAAPCWLCSTGPDLLHGKQAPLLSLEPRIDSQSSLFKLCWQRQLTHGLSPLELLFRPE